MSRSLGILREGRSALFLCDMQEKFRQPIQFFSEIVSVSNRLLKAAKVLDLPVIVTEQYPAGLGKTVKELGIECYPDIEAIEKTQFSMLTEAVDEKLSKLKPVVSSVILCGIEAHVCVQGTCLDLLRRGYEVHIVANAVSSRTQVDRLFALDRMRAAGAFVTTYESVILGLLGDSSHTDFRQLQKLILEPAPDTGLLSASPLT